MYFYIYLFVRYFLTFFLYIFLPPPFTPHFLKIADWQSKACDFKFLTRERLFNFLMNFVNWANCKKRSTKDTRVSSIDMANRMVVLDKDLKECYKHDFDWTLLPDELHQVSHPLSLNNFEEKDY